MKIIAANFKMNLTKKEIDNYLKEIDNKKINNVIFFPSNLYIPYFSKYNIGSQDISFKEIGSITGDTSIKQYLDFNIKYVLIGHSERRKYFNDSKYISDKVNLALKNNIIPIICVGETEEEYNNNLTKKVLKDELDEALENNITLLNNEIIIAYEPIFSIGTNKVLDIKEIENIITYIKSYLKNTYLLDIKVLYGGSVNLNNIGNLEKISNLDGYLIGNASLDAKSFLDLTSKIK
ncbi:MAG: triose-phosphate isomerase [Erysipelotrichaceae bacterium]|nr:triose-phosphate isomerase [Erysipelotrichaceae bacterium]